MMLNNVSASGVVGDNGVVEGYEEISDIDELVRGDGNSELQFDDDRSDVVDGDEFGGMHHTLYSSILEYKRSGILPPGIDKRHDRSAPSHWRSRCSRFTLADDNKTLLYYNPGSPINDQPKVVIKRGEVRKVLERIHELIGHLGQKRTQIVVLRKLHWRSVRQDVRHYINLCQFCNQKKIEGRKITKAPVDITSDNFDINVSIRDTTATNGDRLEFTLVGYNEQDVRAAAYTRMTSYTFKETSEEYRSRYYMRDPTHSSGFRRQPYVKRERVGQYAVGYIVPYNQRGRNLEPEFIEIYERPNEGYQENDEGEDYEQVVEEIVEPMGVGELILTEAMIRSGVVQGNLNVVAQEEQVQTTAGEELIENTEENVSIPVRLDGQPLRLKRDYKQEDCSPIAEGSNQRIPESPRRFSAKKDAEEVIGIPNKKRRHDRRPCIQGIASRFSMAMGEQDASAAGDMVSSLDSFQSRPELLGLPPICLMPSLDSQVIQMQKELLSRQLSIQKMQEKVLQAQYDATVRIPITKYSHVTHEHAEIVEQDAMDAERELNVIDEDEETIRTYSGHTL